LCGFLSATLGAGVVAAQRPIACPKRHIPPERYVQYAKKYLKYGLKMFKINGTNMYEGI
jgi:hypothetical protein